MRTAPTMIALFALVLVFSACSRTATDTDASVGDQGAGAATEDAAQDGCDDGRRWMECVFSQTVGRDTIEDCLLAGQWRRPLLRHPIDGRRR